MQTLLLEMVVQVVQVVQAREAVREHLGKDLLEVHQQRKLVEVVEEQVE